MYSAPNTHLVGVQLALVHRVGVLNDFYLVLPKSLPVETLRRHAERSFVSGRQEAVQHTQRGDGEDGGITGVYVLHADVYLQPVRDFRQLCDGRLFVHELLLVQVTEF